MKKLGLITFNITHEAPRRAIQIATLFNKLTHFVYLLASTQLMVISTQDQTIINNDIIRIIVIKRFIKAPINVGKALIGVTLPFPLFSNVVIQFPMNGMSVLSFIHLHSLVAGVSHSAYAGSLIIIDNRENHIIAIVISKYFNIFI
jgi:hypothetical protein